MSNSVSQWIVDLQKGDADAAQRLWERYFKELVEFARKRINKAARTAADEEDVALSVFDSLCRGAEAGRFSKLKGRHELWLLLLALTRRKIADKHRFHNRQKFGAAEVVTETDVPREATAQFNFKLDNLLDGISSPDLILEMDEEWQRLLQLLRDNTLRRIASWRMEGYSVPEIADLLGVLPRTVHRKLQLIRSRWWKELEL